MCRGEVAWGQQAGGAVGRFLQSSEWNAGAALQRDGPACVGMMIVMH